MRLDVVFATPDPTLRTFIGLRKERLIPVSVLAKGYFERSGSTLRVSSLEIGNGTSIADLTEQVVARSAGTDGLILMIDGCFVHLAQGVRDAAFVVPFDGHYGGKSLQNRIGAILTPTLKHYAYLAERFGDGKFRKILLLPLDIFRSDELARLRDLVARDNMTAGFGERLDGLLASFSDRQLPKKRAAYPDKYLRDDRRLFFQYGHEEHAHVEAHAPHTATCVFNSDFRFGCRYDKRRHFNVSEEGENDKVSGEFLSCHGQLANVTKRSHVNIFPNGFV